MVLSRAWLKAHGITPSAQITYSCKNILEKRIMAQAEKKRRPYKVGMSVHLPVFYILTTFKIALNFDLLNDNEA